MQKIHDDTFFQVSWDGKTRVIRIDWKEATASMNDEDFKSELDLFAGLVEERKARGILVDLEQFRHRPSSDLQPWRVKNISTRYAAAGVKRFAFLFPPGAQVPPMMNQSSPGESFETRAFNSVDEATKWLIGSD